MYKNTNFTKNRKRGVFMINFNTDLADERRDIYRKANNISDEIPGIETEEKEFNENIKDSKVMIKDERGEQAIGKPIRNIYNSGY